MDKEAYKAEKEVEFRYQGYSKITSISQKTKLICYELEGIVQYQYLASPRNLAKYLSSRNQKRIEKSCHETGFFYSSSYQIHLDTHSVRIFQGVLRFSHPVLFGE